MHASATCTVQRSALLFTPVHMYEALLQVHLIVSQEDVRAREREAGRAEAAFVRETAERVAAEVCF